MRSRPDPVFENVLLALIKLYTWDSDSFYQEQALFSIVHTVICIKSLKTSYLMKQDGTRVMGLWELVIRFSLLLYRFAIFNNKGFKLVDFFYSPSQDIEYFHNTMIFLVFHFYNPSWLTGFSRDSSILPPAVPFGK